MPNVRGKSFKALAIDVSEGYTVINPLFLKPLDAENIKVFYQELLKVQIMIRGETFPYSDVQAIRWRNLKLQRLHSASMIIRNYARERRIPLI